MRQTRTSEENEMPIWTTHFQTLVYQKSRMIGALIRVPMNWFKVEKKGRITGGEGRRGQHRLHFATYEARTAGRSQKLTPIERRHERVESDARDLAENSGDPDLRAESVSKATQEVFLRRLHYSQSSERSR